VASPIRTNGLSGFTGSNCAIKIEVLRSETATAAISAPLIELATRCRSVACGWRAAIAN
jgi:hypothetical protein